MERALAAEWLDEDLGSAAEVASALRSLRWVNRLFGGNRMHRRLLKRVLTRTDIQRQLQILEVAAGGADALAAAIRGLRLRPNQVKISLSDRRIDHLPPLQGWLKGYPEPRRLAADALELPLPEESVDVVSSCLFLHHLSPWEAQSALEEALRVARIAVFVNDLERNWLHFQLARLMSLVDPSRLSRHDGPVSVRQSWTCGELAELAKQTGRHYELHRGYLFRVGLILWK